MVPRIYAHNESDISAGELSYKYGARVENSHERYNAQAGTSVIMSLSIFMVVFK